ncbi:MAG: serine/threonine-protein kinase [Elainellaceae cyanobacterium]
MTIPLGTTLQNKKYILQRELGQGGFGVTYLARHQILDQVVVIKTLNDALRQDPDFLKFQHQFREEAQRLARFAHPNIVRVSDFFVENELPCIVMDFIPGQTLKERVAPRQPLPEAIALHYIRQVAAALKVVHANGLLHRDVKPQNIILRQGTHEVVLIDFGIAREFTPGITQTHTGILSAGYAPIEQYMPRAKRTPATDVYGLAATLYTLLTGEVPVAALIRNRQPLPPPRNLQPEISALTNEAVMRGMAIEPEHRPASIDAWLDLLPDSQSASLPAAIAPAPAATEPTLALAPNHNPLPAIAAVPPVPPAVSATETWAAATNDPVANLSTPARQTIALPSKPKSRLGLFAGLAVLGGLLAFGNGLLSPSSSTPPSSEQAPPAAEQAPATIPELPSITEDVQLPNLEEPPSPTLEEVPTPLVDESPSPTSDATATPTEAATPIETVTPSELVSPAESRPIAQPTPPALSEEPVVSEEVVPDYSGDQGDDDDDDDESSGSNRGRDRDKDKKKDD